jgi:hypothetical protein
MPRFGFYRTMTVFPHPIDTGNAMALVAGLIAALAVSVGRKLTEPAVLFPLGAALMVALTAMSFTTFMVLALAVAIAVVMYKVPALGGQALLVVAVIYIGGVLTTAYLINQPFVGAEDNTLAASAEMRKLIVQVTWEYGSRGNLLGLGDAENLDLPGLHYGSIDNAYMLMILERGWLYLIGFLSLGVALAVPLGRAITRLPIGEQRLPLILGFVSVVATMAGMYTVFFGFSYAVLWMMTLGLTASMTQYVREQTSVVASPMVRGVVANPAMPRVGRPVGETIRPSPLRALGR